MIEPLAKAGQLARGRGHHGPGRRHQLLAPQRRPRRRILPARRASSNRCARTKSCRCSAAPVAAAWMKRAMCLSPPTKSGCWRRTPAISRAAAPVDWGALLGFMAAAAEQGRDPFAEAVRVQERLFTTKPIFLGVEESLQPSGSRPAASGPTPSAPATCASACARC